MKIGLISDTHGSLKAWRAALAGPLAGSHMILHAGDVLYHGPRNPLPDGYAAGDLAEAMNQCSTPIAVARGNCDSEVDAMVLNVPLQSPVAVWPSTQGTVVVVHGHGYTEDDLVELGRRTRAAIVVSGHTHIPSVVRKDGLWLVKPGSPSLPKGTDPVPSAGWLDDDGIRVVDLHSGEPLFWEGW